MALAVLEVALWTRLALNSVICLSCLLSTGIKGVCYHTRLQSFDSVSIICFAIHFRLSFFSCLSYGHHTKKLRTQVYSLRYLPKLYTWSDIHIPFFYQMFREVQLLTRTDIYKKTRHILESYSENILTAFSVVDNPINTALQEKMKHYTD